MNESETIRRAMSIIGSRKSAAKTRAARENSAKRKDFKGWPKGKKRPKKI